MFEDGKKGRKAKKLSKRSASASTVLNKLRPPHFAPKPTAAPKLEPPAAATLTDQMAPMLDIAVPAQRQAVQPVFQALRLQREEMQRVEAPRQALQRQRQAFPTFTQAQVAQAIQREQERTAPAPIIRKPQSNADWVTVMRQQAEQAEGRAMLSRENEQFKTLQRQVAQRLAAGYRQDARPSETRTAEYAGHLATLQRHPISGQVAQVVMSLVPQGERPTLQRAVDEVMQREALQHQQDEQALQLRSIQRQLAELDEQAAQPIMQRIQARRGAGNPLPAAIQRHLEQGLNHDLSAVRIHDDAEADKLAKGVNAIAFTTGTDIFFRSGRYEPNNKTGLELLAHEVTHTVQQSQGKVGAGIDPDAGLEQEARAMGSKLAVHGDPFQLKRTPTKRPGTLPVGQATQAVQRQATPTATRATPAASTPPDQSATATTDPLLTNINKVLRLSLKAAKDVYPTLKTDAAKRLLFFQQVYTAVPTDSELGKLLTGSKEALIIAYVEAFKLKEAKKTWKDFPKKATDRFATALTTEMAGVINLFGGNASVFNHRHGGKALIEAAPAEVKISKEVKFKSIGTFPKDLTFSQAKSRFINKTIAIWSKKHKLIVKDSKTTLKLPIKVDILVKNDAESTINIYGSKFGRSNASGTTINMYLHDSEGKRETQYGLVSAHEAGHFIFGAKDEYKDIIDSKTKKVTGAKSTTKDKSIMAVFYDFPTTAQSHARHFSELLVNFKKMYPKHTVKIE